MEPFHVPTGELTRFAHVVQDSVVVESPLPGGVATLVRFFLQSVPQWIQIGGAILGVVVGVVVVMYLWTRRAAIVTALSSRSKQFKIALAVVASLVVLGAAGVGAASWDYMQHDNGFCTGCHVMESAFVRFEQSEHDSLTCHDCHQQSIFASMRQLYLWVAERPAEIGEHAPVPDAICQNCHVTGEPEVWQRIASTAGHRTHLESDSVDVMCVTCHGQEVHQFVPVDQTCGQSGCHETDATDITIGAMQEQTALHCVTCHEFVAEVPALATPDSAAATLVPGFDRCTSCHEMQAVLEDFDPELDPHAGTCGYCHNPHEQTNALDAAATCTTSGCHDDWRNEPFHTGTSHVDVGNQCTLCHEPHRARVDASDCTGCHSDIASRPGVPPSIRQRLQRVQPFDTSAAVQGSIDVSQPPAAASETPIHAPMVFGYWGGGMISEPLTQPPQLHPQIPVARPDSFTHEQHTDLACLTCHTTQAGHGPLTFEAPRGCQICHHRNPTEIACEACHEVAELGPAITARLSVAVENTAPRERDVAFAHTQHAELECTSCHTEPVTLASAEPIRTCTDCHIDHHAAERACVQCHQSESPEFIEIHGPPNESHRGCTACHSTETVSHLVPDAQFCETCHTIEDDHPPLENRACTVCHFLETPEQYRQHLVGTSGGL